MTAVQFDTHTVFRGAPKKYLDIDDLKPLGFDLTDVANDDLLSICALASAVADGYCLQELASGSSEVDLEFEEIVEVRCRKGLCQFAPTRHRASRATRIRLLDVAGDGENIDITRVRALPGNVLAFPYYGRHGLLNAEVKYIYGYKMLPANIKPAIVMIAAQLLDNYFFAQNAGFWGMDAVQQGNVKMSRTGQPIPAPAAQKILESYRRVRG